MPRRHASPSDKPSAPTTLSAVYGLQSGSMVMDSRPLVVGLSAVTGHSVLPESSTAMKVTQSKASGAPSTNAPASTKSDDGSPLTLPGDRMSFSFATSMPGVPIVTRNHEERAANPDRLNLDRRRLRVCPLLDNEEHIRLLNYQHNFIRKIERMSSLRRLIFLDLYDNEIEEIAGLHMLKSLRVLMLGKNRIQKIENLHSLSKLDVLDLHGNQIEKIENISHLSELRVLNLAGNNIRSVEKLAGLDSLAEFNVRRNNIDTVTDIDKLPNLQRLFLSFNRLANIKDLNCLSEAPSLTEVSLDGNPLCHDLQYRQTIILLVHGIKQLDMKRVLDEESRLAVVVARKEEERARQSNKINSMKEKRLMAIKNAKRHWETMQNDLVLKTSSLLEVRNSVLVDAHSLSARSSGDRVSSADSTASRPDSGRATSPSNVKLGTISTHSARRRPASSRQAQQSSLALPDRSDLKHQRPSSSKETKTKSKLEASQQFSSFNHAKDDSSHLVEIQGDQLKLYGPRSLEFFDQSMAPPVAGQITTICFSFVDFEEVAKYLHKIRARLPNVVAVHFTATNICTLTQLNLLASFRKLDSVYVSEQGNPVTKLRLWREYLMFRLGHFPIKRINGHECFTPDVVRASELFEPLARATNELIPTARLMYLADESKRKYVQAYVEGRTDKTVTDLVSKVGLAYHRPDDAVTPDQARRKALSKSIVTNLGQVAASTCKQLQEFYHFWPELLFEMTHAAVEEMLDIKRYERKCWEDFFSETRW